MNEINVSSNCFTTCNLPELGHLLDLSGNKIDSLRPLPFMPSLRRLSVAFNFICSLEGLHDSTSHLVYLDVRGNLISRRSEILDPVQRLTALQSLLLGQSYLQEQLLSHYPRAVQLVVIIEFYRQEEQRRVG